MFGTRVSNYIKIPLLLSVVIPIFILSCTNNDSDSVGSSIEDETTQNKNSELPTQFGTEHWAYSPPDSLGSWAVKDEDINQIMLCGDIVVVNEVLVTEIPRTGKIERITAIDDSSGNRLWSFSQDYITHSICGDNNVYISSINGIDAVDLDTGKKSWTYKTNPSGHVAYKNDNVYFLGSEYIHSVISQEERVEWKKRLPTKHGVHNIIGPLVYGKYIIVIYDHKNPLEGVEFFPSEGESDGNDTNSDDSFSIYVYDIRGGSLLSRMRLEGVLNKERISIVNGYLYTVATRHRNVEEGFEKEDQVFLFNVKLGRQTTTWAKNITSKEVVFGEKNIALTHESTIEILSHESGKTNNKYSTQFEIGDEVKLDYPYVYTQLFYDDRESMEIGKYNLNNDSLHTSHRRPLISYDHNVYIYEDYIYIYDGSDWVYALHNFSPTLIDQQE